MEENNGAVDLGDIFQVVGSFAGASPENSTMPLDISIGAQRVAKYFDDGILYFGTVTKYFEPNQTKSGIHLWNILFDDGDKEDFNRFELREAIHLYEQNESLDNQKPPARRVTLSPVFKDDLEESEHSEEEVIRPSATRTRKRSHWCESSEDEDDEEEHGGTTIKSLTTRKPYAAIDESSDDESDHEATPKRLTKISSLKMAGNKYARIEPQAAIDESSDEGDDSEKGELTSERLAKIKSPEARQKYARLEHQAWLGTADDEFSADEDSDDDEEELEAEEGFHRSELEYHMGRRRKGRRLEYGVPPEQPIDLTVEQKNEMLRKIEKPGTSGKCVVSLLNIIC